MTSIENANNMINILNWMSKLLNINIEYWQLDCNTTKTNREKIINNFKECVKIAILINVHILDEGININECDSVFITQPNNNIINIIQRMCRANRITKNKNNCNIYLWCKENKTTIILDYIFNNTDEFVKDKVYIYNTENKIIKKHITETINDNNDIIYMSRYNTINFEKHKIIVIIDNDNIIWFNAKQICISLEYKQPKQAISKNVEKIDKIQLKNMNISFEMQQQPDSIY
jgi:superfamily II DNA or RNA helicase